MIKHIGAIILSGTLLYATDIKDEDFDGVPDNIDECPMTPFLSEVNAQGCATNTLMLPIDTETDSLVLVLKSGYSINDDLIGRETQQTQKIRLTYYKDNWSYSLRTGYYTHNEGDGTLDTTLRVKRRFNIHTNLKVGLSAAIRLPTYNFSGNKTDVSLYTSVTYYPFKSFSFFMGGGHTFIRDKKIITPLKNTSSFYIGTGYFVTKKLYTNISYTYAESKFTTEHAAKSIAGILYYQINKKWFTTLSYSKDIDDEDQHDSLNFSIGYRFW